MSDTAIAAYIAARDARLQAETEAESLAKKVEDVARKIASWKTLILEDAQGRLSQTGGAYDAKAPRLRLEEWPSYADLQRVFGACRDTTQVALTAWKALPVESQKSLQPLRP